MDQNDPFAHLFLKEYDQWELFLHEQQYPYIGRCYAWSKNDDKRPCTYMSSDEREELFRIVLPDWEVACNLNFKHDWTNIASLGNTMPRLHWHFIPRYYQPVPFEGIEFIDKNPTGNYSPYEKKAVDPAVVQKVISLMKEQLFLAPSESV